MSNILSYFTKQIDNSSNNQLIKFIESLLKLKKLRVFEFFSGFGSQHKSLSNLKKRGLLNYEVSGISEWYISGINSYSELHCKRKKVSLPTDSSGQIDYIAMREYLNGFTLSRDSKNPYDTNKLSDSEVERLYVSMKRTNNYGSVCDIKGYDLPSFIDVLTYSFPCQDISNSGKKQGFKQGENTRSGLVWEIVRILKEMKILNKLPKVLLMENVPQIISSRNIEDYNVLVKELELLGYTTTTQILDSSEYGSTQVRKRAFGVSVLNKQGFEFSKGQKNDLTLNDILQKRVSKKLNVKVPDSFVKVLKNSVKSSDSTESNFNTSRSGIKSMVVEYSKFDMDNRLYSSSGKCPTLTTSKQHKILVGKTIRYLTPKESMKLMGFSDYDYKKLSNVISKTDIYKMSGNSIVVSVLESIFMDIYNFINTTVVDIPVVHKMTMEPINVVENTIISDISCGVSSSNSLMVVNDTLNVFNNNNFVGVNTNNRLVVNGGVGHLNYTHNLKDLGFSGGFSFTTDKSESVQTDNSVDSNDNSLGKAYISLAA